VGLGEAAREQLAGQLKLAHQLLLALAQAGSLGAVGVDLPLEVPLYADKEKSK
jgi:hypothetical protein